MIGWAALPFAGAALAAAGLAVTRANAVHAVLWMLAALLALAGAFLALGAPFAGGLQILVQAGAIVVLFAFAVTVLDLSAEAVARERARIAWREAAPAALAALAVLAPLTLAAVSLDGGAGGEAGLVGPEAVGRLLFGPWMLAVELASLLLLAALIAARHLGRRGEARR